MGISRAASRSGAAQLGAALDGNQQAVERETFDDENGKSVENEFRMPNQILLRIC